LLIGINYFFKASTVKYSTGFGEQKTFALLDGSQVTLNANSVLSYNKLLFSKKRNVFLKGEAFFKVKKGKTFTVKTPNGSVQVLGTEFSVTSYDDFFKVHCYSGKVKVVQQAVSEILLANQVYLKMNKNDFQIASDDTNIPYWLKGETSFISTPAKYVFKAFKSQYNVDIDTSKINNDILFTGTFPNKNKKIALDIIANTLHLTYKITDGKIVFEEK
jgi:ferric-dicitrate binding protein FerR (iron transport regulator)